MTRIACWNNATEMWTCGLKPLVSHSILEYEQVFLIAVHIDSRSINTGSIHLLGRPQNNCADWLTFSVTPLTSVSLSVSLALSLSFCLSFSRLLFPLSLSVSLSLFVFLSFALSPLSVSLSLSVEILPHTVFRHFSQTISGHTAVSFQSEAKTHSSYHRGAMHRPV